MCDSCARQPGFCRGASGRFRSPDGLDRGAAESSTSDWRGTGDRTDHCRGSKIGRNQGEASRACRHLREGPGRRREAFYADMLGLEMLLQLHERRQVFGSISGAGERSHVEVFLKPRGGGPAKRNGVNHFAWDREYRRCRRAHRSQGRQAHRTRSSHATTPTRPGSRTPTGSKIELIEYTCRRGAQLAGGDWRRLTGDGQPTWPGTRPPEGHRRRDGLFGQHRIAGAARQPAHPRGDARPHPVERRAASTICRTPSRRRWSAAKLGRSGWC